MNQTNPPREPGDLLDIVEACEWRRLTADDYLELVALRDHFDRRRERVQAALVACPLPPLNLYQ